MKARKEYTCRHCHKTIVPGSEYHRVQVGGYGNTRQEPVCMPCHRRSRGLTDKLKQDAYKRIDERYS